MRRSFYILIGSLAICIPLLVFEKSHARESASPPMPETFGHHVHIDLDLSDPNLLMCKHPVPHSVIYEPQIKNSPKSIDLDY